MHVFVCFLILVNINKLSVETNINSQSREEDRNGKGRRQSTYFQNNFIEEKKNDFSPQRLSDICETVSRGE